jgi:hypothetical protein
MGEAVLIIEFVMTMVDKEEERGRKKGGRRKGGR